MPVRDLHSELGKMRADIRAFASCLDRASLLDQRTVSSSLLEGFPAQHAARQCAKWGYWLQKVSVDLDPSKVSWPQSARHFRCTFDIKINGHIHVVQSTGVQKKSAAPVPPWSRLTEPQDEFLWNVDELAIDIEFDADSDDLKGCRQTWHLDRHIEGTKDNPSPPEAHPLFHMHFGGRKMAECRRKTPGFWGRMLELEAPRLAHPPIDFILLVDFLLSNFDGSQRDALVKNEKEYRASVIAAQRRFWRPYKRALGGFSVSDRATQPDHPARWFWPTLVPLEA